MILSTIVLLGVLIFVHELGHFWAAKSVGIGVERFSIGLGPRIWGFTRGETEYIIAAIPLGGYVKMQGMEDEVQEKLEGGKSPDLEEEIVPTRSRDGDFDSKPIWARAFVISAGVIMNMIFAFLIYTSTNAIWGIDAIDTTRVMSVESPVLPVGAESLAQLTPGAEIMAVGDVNPETWNDIAAAIANAPVGPLTLITANPSASFTLTLSGNLEDRRDVMRALVPWRGPVLSYVEANSSADDGGVEEGDRLLSVDGVPVANWDDIVREVSARPGESVAVELERDGATLTRLVELASVEDDETGETVGRMGVIGSLESVSTPVSLGQAISMGGTETLFFSRAILGFLGDLFTGKAPARSVGSIGTIAQASGQAAELGLPAFLKFMAFFSINLAILNLLPIPILDGGHLVFLGLEFVRGQPLSIENRMRASQVGLVLLLGIMAWALGNDLLRWLGIG